jgi:hypothetical protein
MKLIVVVVSLALAGMAAAQCGAKLKDAGDCVADLASKRFEELANRDVRAESKDCFAKSGCTAPEVLPDDDEGEQNFWVENVLKEVRETLDRLNVLDEQKTADLMSKKDTFFKCGVQVLDNMKSDIEVCMRKKDKFSDFTAPDFLVKIGQQVKAGGMDEKLKATIDKLAEFFGLRLSGVLRGLQQRGPKLLAAVFNNEVCPSTENKDNMKTCLEGVYSSSEPQIPCVGLKECKDKLGADCKDIKRDLTGALCECSSEIVDTKFLNMFTFMKSCLETEFKIPNLIPAGIPEKLAQKVSQKLTKKVLTDFCAKIASDPLNEACS